MKRKFFLLCIFLYNSLLFCQQENLVYSETFLTSSVQDIKVEVEKQNIYIAKYNGEEILVEMDCNNLSLKSNVFMKDKELNIKSNDYEPSKVDYCDIYIYIPFSFVANAFYINTNFGNIKIDDINIKEELNIYTDVGNCTLTNVKVKDLMIFSYNKIIECNKIKCDSIIITSIEGDIEVSFLEYPKYYSKIESYEGNVIFWSKKEKDLEKSTIQIKAPKAKLFIKEEE